MTEDQFVVWLQGYLSLHIYNPAMRHPNMCPVVDAKQFAADVLAAARTVALRDGE